MRFMIEKVEELMRAGQWGSDPFKNSYPFEDVGGDVVELLVEQMSRAQLGEVAIAIKESGKRAIEHARELDDFDARQSGKNVLPFGGR